VTEKGVTETFTDVLPGVSDSADITITYNSVFHITELDNGTYHVTGTLAGTFIAVADGVTYTGRFTQWFGENENSRNSEGPRRSRFAGLALMDRGSRSARSSTTRSLRQESKPRSTNPSATERSSPSEATTADPGVSGARGPSGGRRSTGFSDPAAFVR
jgi:hypothetical protein